MYIVLASLFLGIVLYPKDSIIDHERTRERKTRHSPKTNLAVGGGGGENKRNKNSSPHVGWSTVKREHKRKKKTRGWRG